MMDKTGRAAVASTGTPRRRQDDVVFHFLPTPKAQESHSGADDLDKGVAEAASPRQYFMRVVCTGLVTTLSRAAMQTRGTSSAGPNAGTNKNEDRFKDAQLTLTCILKVNTAGVSLLATCGKTSARTAERLWWRLCQVCATCRG
jgi:hypothetical protein